MKGVSRITPPLHVMTLCLGNICRSPVAEALIRRELAALDIEAVVSSSGTGAWHVGKPADPRSQEIAQQHGLILTGKAQQLDVADFYEQHYILAMDKQNLFDAQGLMPPNASVHIQLMRDYDLQDPGTDVPDPYYGGPEGFEKMYKMLERSAKEFAHRQNHKVLN